MQAESFVLTDDDVVLDALPESVEETMKERDRWVESRRSASLGLEFIVSDVQRWVPGQSVRVAFLGGTTPLYREIEEATKVISAACNIQLDFRDGTTGDFRTWSERDTGYAAEIRVSFDMGGYFSLVGIDSINQSIGRPGDPVGGRPGQRSLNLGGFAGQRPPTWRGTARHEFLHALSFHHSHQNMRGPCEQEFRWDDDPGYQPTRDARGVFVTDAAGLRPGIYTYLSGPPNNWSKEKVDHNLRTNVQDPSVVAGPFDRASVMLYRFPPLFYRTIPSPCAPSGDGIDLSDGDQRGLRLLYPHTAHETQQIMERRRAIASDIDARRSRERPRTPGLEAAPGRTGLYSRETLAALQQTLAAVS